ncbi:MAG: amidohydrolase family protein [Pseudomonadota bacterium]
MNQNPTDAGAAHGMRLIATEEAFAPQEYLDEYIKMTKTIDTPVTRYLGMYYQKPEFAQQLTDMDYRLAMMDRHDVAMHLLSITGPGVQAFDADLGSDLAMLTNDKLAAIIKQHPTRFAGLAAVAPQSPERAAREIKRAMTELKLNGIIINSHTHGEFLDDPKFWPILAAAVEHDATIYLHPSFPPDSMLEPYSKYGMMAALWGFQAECSLHVIRMILGGVFDQFPTLRIVLGHLGEGIPYWLSRLDNRYQNILKRGGLASLGMKQLERLPSDYFKTNFHVTTAGMNSAAPFEYCVKLLGAERVLFAIDYPYEQTEDATGFARSLQLPHDQLSKICHGNAERLFNIRA